MIDLRRPPAAYRVFLMDLSYFSGKLEAYLRWKEIPYERVDVSWREMRGTLLPKTGLMKVPSIETPEGEWLQDTTPILDWMERRHPEGAIVPGDPVQAFFCRLLEDYADEWLWRPALHYRWSFGPDRRLLGERLAREVLRGFPAPVRLRAAVMRRRQWQEYVRGDGVTSATRAHVEGVYLGALDRLERVFETSRFLLGDRPSLADFGFFAPMFRHFALDPTPSRIMRDRAPGVLAWVARLWNARRSREHGAWPGAGTIPASWDALIRDAGETHLPCLHANAVAHREGRRRFDWTVQGTTYRGTPVVRYRVWCRERLQAAFHALPAGEQRVVAARLDANGALEPLLRDGSIASGLFTEGDPAVRRPPRRRASLVAQWRGSTWNPDAE